MAPPAEKPAPDDDRSEGVASPDTPEDDEHDEAVATEDEAKASAQDKVSHRAMRSAPARLLPPIRPASILISFCSLTCSSSPSASVGAGAARRGCELVPRERPSPKGS